MGRREITGRMTLDDGYYYVAYVGDALALAADDGDAEVAALRNPVDKVLADNDALWMERRTRRRAIGRAHALVRRRDIQLDGATADVHNDTLGVVKHDRSHPLFVHMFPDPLSQVVRMALGSQLPEARKLHLKLLEPETPADLKKAHEKSFGAAIEKGDQAIRGREAAFSQSGHTTARVEAWKEDANQVLRGVEGALQQIASKRRLKPDWVDSFFPVIERGRPAGGEEEPNVGGGGGGGSGG